MTKNDYLKALRARRKAAGICRNNCGPVLPGRTYCEACADVFKMEARAKKALQVASRQAKACGYCGSSIGVDYKPTGGRPKTFCSDRCGDLHRNPPAQAGQPCVVCQAPCTNPIAVTCSEACRSERARSESRLYSIAKHKLIERRCRDCNKAFTPAYGEKRRTFCSQRCLERHGRRLNKGRREARKRKVESERVDPLRVFARDGWRCQLCGIPTPRRLRGAHRPSSPELDHIVPISKGGPHTYANTQCACRACNSKKGDKVLGQLRLA